MSPVGSTPTRFRHFAKHPGLTRHGCSLNFYDLQVVVFCKANIGKQTIFVLNGPDCVISDINSVFCSASNLLGSKVHDPERAFPWFRLIFLRQTVLTQYPPPVK